MAAKLGELRPGAAVVFEQVVEAARPFLAAIVARSVKSRVWVVCPDVRRQEALHNELQNWFHDALFFPEADVAPVEGALPDPETAAERLGIVQQLSAKAGREVVVLTRASLDDAVGAPDALKQLAIVLKRGKRMDREALIAKLAGAGYEHAPQVSMRGQFAVRGGILDIYSFHHTLPVRIEWFDDEIESLRHFDLDAQTSVQQVDTCTLLLGEAEERTCLLREYVRTEDLTIDAGADWDTARVRIFEGADETSNIQHPTSNIEGAHADASVSSSGEDFSTAFFDHGLGEFEAGDFVVDELKRERFFQQLREWRARRLERSHLLQQRRARSSGCASSCRRSKPIALHFVIGTLANAASPFPRRRSPCSAMPSFSVAIATLARADSRCAARARVQRRAQIDFSELNEDDLVVHLEHGIGRYEGMQTIPRAEGAVEEVLVVAFANDARLYVPLEQSFLLSRYVGVGKTQSAALPSRRRQMGEGEEERGESGLRLRGASCCKCMPSARTANGLRLSRQTTNGSANSRRSFLFKETPDQLTAIAATKADMESERPMDRLICGDVGFGKTEVAIRAAFKAVMGGKQVAILVPTTVLAQQHYHTFRERMRDYPITVDCSAAFARRREQRKTVEGLRERRSRYRHRHASADFEGHRIQKPRPGGDRRGAALRRAAQGAVQGDVPARRSCSRFQRHADSAHALPLAHGREGHEHDRDAAAQSHPDRDAHLPVRRADHPRRDQSRTRAPGAGLFPAQPRAVDREGARCGSRTLPAGADRRRPRADG